MSDKQKNQGQEMSAKTLGFDDWAEKYYCQENVKAIEVRFEKGKTYGPYYRVHNNPEFSLNAKDPNSAQEQNFFGIKKPKSSEEAKEMFALPSRNQACFISEVYITPQCEGAAGIIGVPRRQEECGSVRSGKAQVINFNEAAVSSIKTTKLIDY